VSLSRFLARSLAVMIGVAGGLLAADLGYGVALDIKESASASPAAVNQRIRRALATAQGALLAGEDGKPVEQGAFFIHPYLGWDGPLFQQRLERALASQQAGEFAGKFVVVVVGGSVSGILADPTQGAPEVLAEEIGRARALGDRPVVVINQGRGAVKQPQQVLLVELLLALGLRPDLILNLDGFNEVAIGLQNLEYKCHPLYPSFPQWGPRLGPILSSSNQAEIHAIESARLHVVHLGEFATRYSVSRSAILRHWFDQRVLSTFNLWQSLMQAGFEPSGDDLLSMAKQTPILGPHFAGGPKEALDLAIHAWREGSADLAAMCQRRGIEYVHVLQPTLHDTGSKPLTAEEQHKGKAIDSWVLGVQNGYPRLREGGAALLANGVHFLDATQVFAGVDATLYYDPCHFNRAGNVLLARSIGTFVRDGVLDRAE
jgi:hypothetical protein